uniref:Putative secreted protein n=1 Tax=Anopheles darlingi TaxID=43151 RepID=A0A2M4DJU6_ANODA
MDGWLVGWLCLCCWGPLHCKMEAESDRTLLKQLSQIHAKSLSAIIDVEFPRFHYAGNVCLFKFHHISVP